jgi:hypothetical protein
LRLLPEPAKPRITQAAHNAGRDGTPKRGCPLRTGGLFTCVMRADVTDSCKGKFRNQLRNLLAAFPLTWLQGSRHGKRNLVPFRFSSGGALLSLDRSLSRDSEFTRAALLCHAFRINYR